jgi:Carboxypeptidase regulatory-like domain
VADVARHTAQIFSAVVIVSAISLHAESASACTCVVVSPSPCAAASRPGKIVFVGTVLTEESTMLSTDIPGVSAERGRKLGLSVQETLVGRSRQFVYIETSTSSCGYPFQVGEQYLVYAAGSEQSGFGTGACSRTSPLSQSQTDLVLLRELKSGAVRPRIFGRVMGLLIPPRPDRTSVEEQSFAVPNVIVSAEGQGRREQTVTDADGWFEIVGLKPGRYTVRAHAPREAQPVEPRHVTLHDCGVDAHFRLDIPRR